MTTTTTPSTATPTTSTSTAASAPPTPPAPAAAPTSAPSTASTNPSSTASTPAASTPAASTPAASTPAAKGNSSTNANGAWQPGTKPLPANRRSFKLVGDPHATAGDGKKFNNEQVGTMTQLKSASGDFELQTTQQHPPGNKKVTVNTAAAVKTGNNVVSYDLTRHALTVNGKAVKLKPGASMDLTGGGTVKLDPKGKTVTITSAKDDVVNLHLDVTKKGLPLLDVDGTLGPTRADGEVRGALGNFHAGNGNDFIGADGKSYDAQYGHGDTQGKGSTYNGANVDAFEKSWAVSGKSLLEQNQGQGTNTQQWQKDANNIAKSLNNSKLGLPGEPFAAGNGQLKGADTSAYQSQQQFEDSINGAQWTSIKASQGTSYVDPTFQQRWNELGQKVKDGQMTMRMAYGFLDPGDGQAQAKHFLDTVGVNGPLPAGTRLALDWEGPALNDPQALHDAAGYIHQVTGTWPVVYASQSNVSTAKHPVPDAPVWQAAWGSSPDKSLPFVQYSDGNGSGVDQDVFNGDKQALRKFAGYTS